MMPTMLLVWVIGLVGGVAVGLQSPLASIIGSKLGWLESVFIIHLGGAAAAAIVLLFTGGGKLSAWQTVPWYALLGGVCGMVVIGGVTYTIPQIGATATIILVVAGQLVIGLVLDHFGLLGVNAQPITFERIAGIVVLFIGVWLIVR